MENQTQVGTEKLVQALKLQKASDFMSKKVITTKSSTKLARLALDLHRDRISGLPVVDENNGLQGMITVTDLFDLMTMILDGVAVEEGVAGLRNPTVKFAMSSGTITITAETTLYDIVQLMSKKKIHTLPVVDDGGNLIGIVGRRDVFKCFYQAVNDIEEQNS